MTRVLVTGATGFVGRTLCEVLAASGYTVRAALRSDRASGSGVAERAIVGEVDSATDWRAALEGVDQIVHAAARGHRLSDDRSGEALYLETNARGSRRLAEAAARAGVRRLVYISTVKVNGEESLGGPFTARDEPRPQGGYATSKWLGETYLREAASGSGLEAVIVRPPLVYGPGVGANFLRMLDWVYRGWPVPLGAVRNRRSLLGIWNLCDLVTRLLTHPAAPGRVFMASDGDDRATPDLIREIGRAMQRRVRLVAAPVGLLYAAGLLSGRAADLRRLCGTLQADISATRAELGWTPPVALAEGVARTVRWYLSRER